MGSSQTRPLLRNVRHRAMVTLVSPLPVLPTLRFSREFGLVCLWNCVFFKTWGLLVFGFILIEIRLFFGLVFRRFLFCGLLFFSNFMALLLFQFTAKGILGVFLYKFAHFELVFSNLPPCFLFNFLAVFSFC